VSWDYNYELNYPENSHTAYLWRLPGTVHAYNGNTGQNYDWSVDSVWQNYGETPQTVAFWIKPHMTENSNNVPIEHPSVTGNNYWKWAWGTSPSWNNSHNHSVGIYVGIFNIGATGKNHFFMGKGCNGTGTTNRAIRVGTTTEVADTATQYAPSWFHVVCSFNSCNQGNWKMWVNNVEQTNASHGSTLGSTANPGYNVNELSHETFSPGLSGTPSGGHFSKHGPAYLPMNITDFSYWHAELEADDVAALYNHGVTVGRTAPTEDFTVEY